MSGTKPRMYPKVCRGQLVQVLHLKSGGPRDGAQNIILMMRMEEKLTPIKLKTWESHNGSGCLEERVGVKHVHLGTSASIRGRVFR